MFIFNKKKYGLNAPIFKRKKQQLFFFLPESETRETNKQTKTEGKIKNIWVLENCAIILFFIFMLSGLF